MEIMKSLNGGILPPKWEIFRYFLSTLVLTNNGNLDIHHHGEAGSYNPSCTLELLEGGRAIGLDGQELNSCAVEPEPEAPAVEGPAADAAPKKRAKKEKGAAAKSGADVANPEEASQEIPVPEQQDEQKEPAEKADGNAKRRKKASKADVAAPEVAADEAPTQDQEDAPTQIQEDTPTQDQQADAQPAAETAEPVV